MKPNKPYRLLRALVGTASIVAFGYIWVQAKMAGEALGTMWNIVALFLLVAAAYAVYGAVTVQRAVEDTKTLKDAAEGGSDEEESDGQGE